MKIKKMRTVVLFVLGGIMVLGVAFTAFYVNQLGIEEANADARTELNGKTVLFDGDSIAMGSVACGNAATCGGNSSGKYSYADHIRVNYRTDNTNVSMGGARFYWPNYSTDSNCNHGQDCIIPNHLTSTIKNTTYDYIILEGGTNDLHFYYGNNPENYYSALRSYFDTITGNPKWANAKIGFVIAPKFDYNRKTWYDHDLEADFRRKTQEICDEYSIEYINFFKRDADDGFVVPDGFRNWSFMDTVIENVSDSDEIGSYDGLHPSKGAHEMMGDYIANWMSTLPNYKYTVSFDSNGSSLSGVDEQSIIHGKKAVEPTYTINPDEMFKYWSREASCNTVFSFEAPIESNITLYACWQEKPDETKSFTLTFNINGGEGEVASQTCYTVGDSCHVTIPSTVPVRNSYEFLGYADTADASAPLYQPGQQILLSSNRVIYAIWNSTHELYELSYDMNGGTGGPTNKETCTPTVFDGQCIDDVTISSIKPSRYGFVFLGWSVNADAYRAEYQSGSRIRLSGSITLYAIWAPIYSLTIDANGGIFSSNVDKIQISCNPVVTNGSCEVSVSEIGLLLMRGNDYLVGYADAGSATAVDYQLEGNITLSSNKVVYAVWADGSVQWRSDDDYKVGSGKDVVVKINYPVEHFVKLMVDDIEINNAGNDKYKVESGSTILTVYGTYLDTLAVGSHVFQAIYDNGATIETDFAVEESDSDDPVNPDNPVEPDGPITPEVSPDDNTDSSDDEKDDLPVPSTAGKPDTGENTNGGDGTNFTVIPVATVIIAGLLYLAKRKSGHIRFER